MTTRQIFSASPDGTVGVVFTQRQIADGTWHNQSSRKATPWEISNQTVDPDAEEEEIPMDAPKETPAVSGSHNTHARVAPSASKQWINCTASLALIEANKDRIPKDTGSPWSEEGTEAHDWAAKLLLGQCAVLDIPEKFRKPVTDYATECMSLTPEGVTPLVEVSVPLFYQRTSKGTGDFAIVTARRVTLRDYKHGAGVLVLSYENTQIAIYAMSLIEDLKDLYDFQPDTLVDMAVYQPRHREGADQEPWIVTLAELEVFCAKIAERAELAMQGVQIIKGVKWGESASCEAIANAAPMTEFAPSEGDQGACRWCDAKVFCQVRRAAGLEGIPHPNPEELLAGMGDLDTDEKKLPAEERVEARLEEKPDEALMVALYESSKFIKAFLTDIEDYLTEMGKEGRAVEGTKMVLGGLGKRRWRSEEEADTFLKGQKLKAEDRYTRKLITAPVAEKLLKDKLKKTARTKSRFQALITRDEAEPKLALASDEREAYNPLDGMGDDDDFVI